MVTTSVTATSIAALGYHCKKRFLDWQQDQLNELLRRSCIEEHEMQQHQNMVQTLTRYFGTLNKKIACLCDTDQTVQGIRDGNMSKVEGWEKLKTQVMTKLLLTIHSSCILTMLVSVQLSAASAVLFKSSENNTENKTTERYFCKIKHFLDQGMFNLWTDFEDCVGSHSKVLSLENKVTQHDMLEFIEKCNADIKHCVSDLIKMQLEDDVELKDKSLKLLILVTLDILESKEFQFTLANLISEATLNFGQELDELMKAEHIPLPKLIPQINTLCSLSLNRTDYLNILMKSRQVKCLSRSIYEALI